MSCDYCTSGKNMMRDSYSDVKIGKVYDVYRIYYSDGPHWRTTEPIRFCPMCGEQFPEVVHDSLESIKQDMTLDECAYAKKRGVGNALNASDKQATCRNCEWADLDDDCGWFMRNDLADRLGKLLDEEDKHER